MPVKIQHTQFLNNLMTSEHLQWHNSSVLHAVAYDLAVEDLYGAIVTGVSEQRQRRVELGVTDGLVVVTQDLVRGVAEIHVVPEQSAVI